ncbi:MAG: hypothetical protein H0U64_13685 [Gemmatimonadaceae bacterium]|nr:hypothetical protein [Gemmatimonadaceae bacterium]
MNQNRKYRIPVLVAASILMCAPVAAGAQIAVLGSTVEERNSAPGETYSGIIVVKNLTSVPQPVRIYQTDYTFFADGTSHFDAPGSIPRSNAAWITPSASSITIPPSGEMSVTYTVRVPAVDSLRGTYWSAVMVEGAVTAPRASRGRQVGLGSVMRYSIQIAVHVARPSLTKMSFEKQEITTGAGGERSLHVQVVNDGERGYRPNMWVELYDADGALKGRVEQQRGLLYPGTSLLQKFAFGKLPAGDYKAVVFADAGEDSMFGAQYKLHF